MGTGARRVLISGGEGGLGRALQQAFAAAGYEVAAPGRQALDVADERSVEAWFTQMPPPDCLILNAGVTGEGRLHEWDEPKWETVNQVNLRGAFLCCRAWQRRRPGGMQEAHALFLSSHAGTLGSSGQSGYAAAKAGLIGLARSLAREWGPEQGRANVVLPGFMETAMTRDLPRKVVERYRDRHLLRRFSRVEEVAAALLLLDRLPAVSGQIFALDSRMTGWPDS